MINFATTFEDPEGRPLSYAAESSDVSVLTVAMSGSVLTITPLAAGSATVYGTGFEAASFRFHHSRWQRQNELGWTTLPGTVHGENKLCVYTPVESGLYRMVGDVTIGRDGLTELRFSSNVLNH